MKRSDSKGEERTKTLAQDRRAEQPPLGRLVHNYRLPEPSFGFVIEDFIAHYKFAEVQGGFLIRQAGRGKS